MRIAGVRLPGDRVVWADALDVALSPLDEVRIVVDNQSVVGDVFVAPEQLIGQPDSVGGHVVTVLPPHAPRAACPDVPGGGMPPLGTTWGLLPTRGRVMRLDIVHRLVTVRDDEGNETQMGADTGIEVDRAQAGPLSQGDGS